MSITPFHDLADQLEIIADQVRVLGDAVHTGNYTVPFVAEEDEAPVDPGEPENGTDETDGPPDDTETGGQKLTGTVEGTVSPASSSPSSPSSTSSGAPLSSDLPDDDTNPLTPTKTGTPPDDSAPKPSQPTPSTPSGGAATSSGTA